MHYSDLFTRYRVLYSIQRNSEKEVNRELGLISDDCARIRSKFGFEPTGKQILDVGAGQFLLHARFFATAGQVTALDYEVIPDGSLRKWFELLRQNGIERLGKTIGRKLLGIDRSYNAAIQKNLGLGHLPTVKVVRGDVCSMAFASESFDLVYSRSVLQLVHDPAAALRRMAHVLRPGGVAYAVLHLYTSNTGSLHPRLLRGGDPELNWAHLRPATRDSMQGYAPLNKLRLAEWRDLFRNVWPGSIVETDQIQQSETVGQVDQLLAAHELDGFSREELLTSTVFCLWQKPAR